MPTKTNKLTFLGKIFAIAILIWGIIHDIATFTPLIKVGLVCLVIENGYTKCSSYNEHPYYCGNKRRKKQNKKLTKRDRTTQGIFAKIY